MNVLTECLSQGTSPASVISFAKEYLKQEGFEELYYDKMLSPKENGKFFITPFPDVLFAFTTGNAKAKIQSLRMAFAHVDQPCFKVKGKPDFKSMGCAMLNVEVYGGMMDHTWFDRPLGIAGTIMLRERMFLSRKKYSMTVRDRLLLFQDLRFTCSVRQIMDGRLIAKKN